MIGGVVLALLQAAVPRGIALAGRVRAGDSGAPIIAAAVEASALAGTGAVQLATTDTAGRYYIDALPPGAYHVRVSAFGYEPRELDVYLSGAARVVVDVALTPRPVRLATVRVLGVADPEVDVAHPVGTADVGTTVMRGAALHANAGLPGADALDALARLPGVSTSNEAPTGLHVFGGRAGENAVRLDGIPLFDASHAAGTLTALNPDAIASVTLRAGAPGAEFGDAAASVIDLATTTADSARVASRGALSLRDVRETVVAPLPGAGGQLLLSGRASADQLLSDPRDGGHSGAEYGDVLATVTLPAAGGMLEALAFQSSDGLGFAARSEHDTSGIGGLAPGVVTLRNAMRWSTGTEALRWRGGKATRWDVRLWRTRFGATANWAGSTHLASGLTDLGAAVSAAWRWGGGAMRAGFDADRYDVHYGVTPLGAGPVAGGDTVTPPLALRGAPTVASAFAEARWQLGPRWAVAAGMRDELATTGGRSPEPRLTVRWAPFARVSLAVGYARQHQYLQSLRNEESLFDAVAGVSLPVAAGTAVPALGRRMPAERADQVTAALDVRLPAAIALTVGAFARSTRDVALVAPVTAQPFATQGFLIGSERASGVTAALHHGGARLSADLGWALTWARRYAGGASYAPSFAAAQSLTMGLGVHLWRGTTLQTALTANTGTAASVFASHVEWLPYSVSAGRGDLAGSPGAIIGAVNAARLPAYVRWDVGVRHTWSLHAFGHTASLTGTATVTDLLDRTNALGLLFSPRLGTTRQLLFPGRGLVLGMEWAY